MNSDLFHLAMVQSHIGSLEPDQQAEIAKLVEQLNTVLYAATDQLLAQTALALVAAANLVMSQQN